MIMTAHIILTQRDDGDIDCLARNILPPGQGHASAAGEVITRTEAQNRGYTLPGDAPGSVVAFTRTVELSSEEEASLEVMLEQLEGLRIRRHPKIAAK